MKISSIYSLAFGILLLGAIPNPAMGFTLDLFNDTESNSTFIDPPGFAFPYDGQQAELNGSNFGGQPLVPSSDPDTGLSDVIGGQRTLSVEENNTVATGSPGGGTINLKVDTAKEEVSFNVNAGTNGSASILWDGITASDEDLTIDDQNSFLISILSIDIVSGVTLNFEVTDEFSNSGVISNPVSSTGNAYFLYDDVMQNPANTSNVSFKDARSIEFYTSGEPDDLDFRFDFITSSNVPFEFSPSLGIIIGGGFLGINILRKKLKAA